MSLVQRKKGSGPTNNGLTPATALRLAQPIVQAAMRLVKEQAKSWYNSPGQPTLANAPTRQTRRGKGRQSRGSTGSIARVSARNSNTATIVEISRSRPSFPRSTFSGLKAITNTAAGTYTFSDVLSQTGLMQIFGVQFVALMSAVDHITVHEVRLSFRSVLPSTAAGWMAIGANNVKDANIAAPTTLTSFSDSLDQVIVGDVKSDNITLVYRPLAADRLIKLNDNSADNHMRTAGHVYMLGSNNQAISTELGILQLSIDISSN